MKRSLGGRLCSRNLRSGSAFLGTGSFHAFCSARRVFLIEGQRKCSTAVDTAASPSTGRVVAALCKAGKVDEAFEEYQGGKRCVYGASNLIAAFGRRHKVLRAFEVFRMLVDTDVRPNDVVLHALVTACKHSGGNQETATILAGILDEMDRLSIEPNNQLSHLIIGTIGEMQHSKLAARVISSLNGGTWKHLNPDKTDCGQILKALVAGQQNDDAFALLDYMSGKGILADAKLYTLVLTPHHHNNHNLHHVQRIHAHIRNNTTLEINDSLSAALISAYSRARSLQDALSTFNELSKTKPDSSHDNTAIGPSAMVAMISAYAQHGHLDDGLPLFEGIINEGKIKPDGILLNSIANICLQHHLSSFRLLNLADRHGTALPSSAYSAILLTCTDLSQIKMAHNHLRLNLREIDDVLASTLVKVYAKQGRFSEGKAVFENLLSSASRKGTFSLRPAVKLGTSTWNSMLAACCAEPYAYGDRALTYFEEMTRVGGHVKPDAVTLTLVATAARNHHKWSASRLLDIADKTGIVPTAGFYSVLLAMATDRRRVGEGERLHQHIRRNSDRVEMADFLAAGLITMYSTCARIEDAVAVFNDIRDRKMKDGSRVLGLGSWNAMMQAYAQHRRGEPAIELFEDIVARESLAPDNLTLTSYLMACGYAGHADKAAKVYHSMKQRFGISPDIHHQNCVVDAFARAALFEEAEEFIRQHVPQPTAVTWKTLLAASVKYEKIDRAERYDRFLKADFPKDTSARVLLANGYARARRYQDLERVRQEMRDEKVTRKAPSLSWIELDGRQHDFTADDMAHLRIKEIHVELERIASRMKEALIETEPLHDWEDEAKFYHSEKLALGMGLISTPAGSPLTIFKTTRMTTDCHELTKLISRIMEREITVGDVSCFHHFKNGCCSCKDFF